MKKILLSLVFLLVSASPVFAHPGRTDSSGCHVCRTNCDKWGVSWNVKHCHGGSVAPVVTAKPTVKATPLPTRIYTPAPTKIATPTLTKLVTPTPTPTATPTPTVEPTVTTTLTPTIEVTAIPTNTPTPTVLGTKTTQGRGFWGWLSRMFGGK